LTPRVSSVPDRQQSGVYRYCSFIPIATMDIVQQCLSLTSEPCLISAFSAFNFIWSNVEQAQVSKTQLEALAQSIAQLLLTLDGEYRVGKLQDVKTSMALAHLCRFVRSSNAVGLNVLIISTSIAQANRRDLSFRSKTSIDPIFEAPVHQESKNRSH
jgi:hypothetical protein